MLDRVAGVGGGAPGAGDLHVAGHGDRPLLAPAGEDVAGGGGGGGHGEGVAVAVGLGGGQLGGAGRGLVGVAVGHVVDLAVVVDVNHGGAVGGDGLLGDGLGVEALDLLGLGAGLLAGGAGEGFVGGQGGVLRVLLAGDVLEPVLDRVAGVGARFPLGVEDVVAAVANANTLASVYLKTRAVLLGVPRVELIASRSTEGVLVGLHERVNCELFRGVANAGPFVGVVGHLDQLDLDHGLEDCG